jgi:hypothetical protein
MFNRSAMLVLFSVLCVLASASAHAAGEFEAKYRKIFVDAFVEDLKNQGYNPREAYVKKVADCHMNYVLRGFTDDEIAQLDAWAAGGKSPGKLAEAAARRMGESPASCVFSPTAHVHKPSPARL